MSSPLPDMVYDALSEQDLKDLDQLWTLCRKGHKGPGGAAICICGAGCGGTAACRGLAVYRRILDAACRIQSPEGFRRRYQGTACPDVRP